MKSLEYLIYYPTLHVNGKEIPVVYVDNVQRRKPYTTFEKVEIYGASKQCEIDMDYMIAFVKLHRGKTI